LASLQACGNDPRPAPEEPVGQVTAALVDSDSWLVIPAYYYAGSDTLWNQLLNNLPARSWGYIVIVTGPASGPPTVQTDIDLLRPRITALHNKGAQVLGYISFKPGTTYSQIQTDVTNWKTVDPTIEGIFYDVAARSDASDVGKAKTLWRLVDSNFNYARQFQPATVIFNWGQTTPALRPYVDCVTQVGLNPGFDEGWTNIRFASWEGYGSNPPAPYRRYLDDTAYDWSSDNDWAHSYRPDMFIHLVHNYGDGTSQVQSYWNKARSRNAAAMFLTEQGFTDTGVDLSWNSPPSASLLSAEISSVINGHAGDYTGQFNNPAPNGCVAPNSCACPDYTPTW